MTNLLELQCCALYSIVCVGHSVLMILVRTMHSGPGNYWVLLNKGF